MTIELNDNLSEPVLMDFEKTNDISAIILTALRKESIGYAQLGCALTLARLANPDTRLSFKQETDFIAACMEWTGTYFAIPIKAGELAN